MVYRATPAEWMLFVKTLNYNLLEKCLKLAQLLEYPDLDVNQYINSVGQGFGPCSPGYRCLESQLQLLR